MFGTSRSLYCPRCFRTTLRQAGLAAFGGLGETNTVSGKVVKAAGSSHSVEKNLRKFRRDHLLALALARVCLHVLIRWLNLFYCLC